MRRKTRGPLPRRLSVKYRHTDRKRSCRKYRHSESRSRLEVCADCKIKTKWEEKNDRNIRSSGDCLVSRVTNTCTSVFICRVSNARASTERNASRNGRRVATPEIACINIGARHFHSVNFPRWTHPRDRDEILYASHVSRCRCTRCSATRCDMHDLVREFKKKNREREGERERENHGIA